MTVITLKDDNGRLLRTLDLICNGSKLFHSAKVSVDDLKRAGNKLVISYQVPILNLHGYWIPSLFRPNMGLDWSISFSCAAHRNFPFLTFFDQDQQNCCSLGIGNLLDDAEIQAKMNQEIGCYEVNITVAVTSETEGFEIFADLSESSWTESLAKYRSFVRPDWEPQYPESAWDPVYCTWYAIHADVRQDWLENQAKTAADMGFDTFIVDDGWCFDEVKRVKPETIGTWYNNIGDWKVSDKKLPDFKNHVARVQQMGMKYLLWVSPFMIGYESEFYQQFPEGYVKGLHEGYKVYDPAIKEMSDQSMSLLMDLIHDYNIDGLKIDFVDAVPQSVETPFGRAVYGYMKTLKEKMQGVNPDTLIEFRQRYATPAMLDMATQFRASDVPFDFIENLHRIAQVRVCLGDNVPVHADPVYWHPNESDLNIARHMICSLAGVPMVSMDLNELPEKQVAIVKNWISFYKEHIETFKLGHWQVKYDFDRVSHISVDTPKESILFVCDSSKTDAVLKSCSGIVHVLNLGNEPIQLLNCQSWGSDGMLAESEAIPLGGRGVVNL